MFLVTFNYKKMLNKKQSEDKQDQTYCIWSCFSYSII